MLLSDHTGRIYRSRAAENRQINGLADYLANALAVRSIHTIQLDIASTASLISFANALAEFDLRPQNHVFDQSRSNLEPIAEAVAQSAPDAVAVFGPPQAAAQAVFQIRGAGYTGELVYNRAHEPNFAERVPSDLLPGLIGVATWSHTLADAASREFTRAYAGAFGRLPDAVAAASYDAVSLFAVATARGGDIISALANATTLNGVQGELNPAGLLPGESSRNSLVTRRNKYGTANVVARYPHEIIKAEPTPAPEIRPTAIPAIAAPVTTATPTGYHLRITREFLNVRSGPGTEYEILGQVIQGAQMRIQGANVDHSWVVVDFRGQSGWVAAYPGRDFWRPQSRPDLAAACDSHARAAPGTGPAGFERAAFTT